MTGVVRQLNVAAGEQVVAGDTLVVLEAMKMELNLNAPRSGEIEAVFCAVDDSVADGFELVSFKSEPT